MELNTRTQCHNFYKTTLLTLVISTNYYYTTQCDSIFFSQTSFLSIRYKRGKSKQRGCSQMHKLHLFKNNEQKMKFTKKKNK